MIYRVSLHMHQRGTAATLTLVRPDGTRQCILDIPRWDVDWQGSYRLGSPLRVEPEDRLELRCTWDNSAPGARDVEWGNQVADEMCSSGLYISAVP